MPTAHQRGVEGGEPAVDRCGDQRVTVGELQVERGRRDPGTSRHRGTRPRPRHRTRRAFQPSPAATARATGCPRHGGCVDAWNRSAQRQPRRSLDKRTCTGVHLEGSKHSQLEGGHSCSPPWPIAPPHARNAPCSSSPSSSWWPASSAVPSPGRSRPPAASRPRSRARLAPTRESRRPPAPSRRRAWSRSCARLKPSRARRRYGPRSRSNRGSCRSASPDGQPRRPLGLSRGDALPRRR